MIDQERLLATFLDYVQIDSETYHEGAMAARLTADMQALGFEVWQDSSQAKTGSQTGNLYCTLPGNLEGEPILFSSHMDTVPPGKGIKPVIEHGIIRSQGDTVLGGDDKSGVAAIVEAMRTIVEQDIPHPTIEVVFTVCEEIGLTGSRFLEYDKIKSGKAFVLDCSGDAGHIIINATGRNYLYATIIGRRAHAGLAPETGISAVQVAAEAIHNMKLLRVDEETTANIATLKCEAPLNIVPDRLELVAEARSYNEEKMEAQLGHMIKCLQDACDQYGATLETRVECAYKAYHVREDDPFVQKAVTACRKLGLKPVLGSTGGGSDANNMNQNGVKALVLGTGMSKVHTTEEELSIQNLEDTAKLVLTLAVG